jgi:oligogalacturonide lyase
MPRGARIGTERIERHDPETGVLVRQVTSFPLIHLHLHYETPTFTPDGQRMLVVGMRGLYRSAPWDLFVMGSNGDIPMQLSGDDPLGMSNACMTVDGKYALYMHGATCHRTDILTADDVELGHVEGGSFRNYYRGMRSYDGRYYLSQVMRGEKVALVRWNLETGEHDVVMEADGINHPKANPGGPEIQVGPKYYDENGKLGFRGKCKLVLHCETMAEMDFRLPEGEHHFAHAYWMGKSGKYQSTLKWPGRGVQIQDPKKDEPELVATGPYFWHSGASMDGKWIIADTNFPDEGLWLINPATKKKERLCWSGSAQGHSQLTHPHPNLSNDGSLAVFASNATGITQVYVVTVPEDMRARLSTP